MTDLLTIRDLACLLGKSRRVVQRLAVAQGWRVIEYPGSSQWFYTFITLPALVRNEIRNKTVHSST